MKNRFKRYWQVNPPQTIIVPWNDQNQYTNNTDFHLKSFNMRFGSITDSTSIIEILKKHRGEPRKIVTDKLKSYGVAHRELIPETIHDTTQYANNRAELSHEPTRVRERGMRKFKSMHQAQRFLNAHAAVYNLF